MSAQSRRGARAPQPNERICYVVTVLPTFRAFIAPVAEHLHRSLHSEISVISSASAHEFDALGTGFDHYSVRMKRGIDFGALGAVLAMYRIFRRARYDIVEYTTPNAALYASIAAWLARVPIRIYNQGGLRYVAFTGWRRRVFKAIEKLTCRLSTHIEPVSIGNLDYGVAEGLYPSGQGAVIWNGSACGVDVVRFDQAHAGRWSDEIRAELAIPADGFVVGFVGRLSRDKGINELLAACRRVMTSRSDVYLLAVGGLDEPEGGLDPHLVGWAESSPSVHLCGTQRDVERFIAAMDCLVLPSYREGFGQVLIEAQAMGVAVVTTAIPGPLDAVVRDETAVLVPPRDVDALSDAIETLATDRELCAQMGRAGLHHARANFAQSGFMERLAQVRRSQLAEAGLG